MLKKANIVRRSDIAKVTGHRSINFLNVYDEADEEERRRLSLLRYAREIMRKANIGSFWHQNNCSSTRPSMAASKENKLSPSFSGIKSQRFLHESSHDGVSGTDNEEQSLNNSASVFYLWLLKAFSTFQNGSILLVSKRRAFIIEDYGAPNVFLLFRVVICI